MRRHGEMVKEIEEYLEKKGYKVVVAPHARNGKEYYESDDNEINLWSGTYEEDGVALSKADITIITKGNIIHYLFEIESGEGKKLSEPKHIISTIEVTNQSNECYIGKVTKQPIRYQIKNSCLFIVLEDNHITYGKRKLNQIRWIQNNYKFTPICLKNFRLCFLKDFKREFEIEETLH